MNLNELIKKKEILTEIEGLILDVKNEENDQMILNLQINDIQYNGIVVIKSDFILTPKKNEILQISKLILKYDESFILKVFAFGKIITNQNNNIYLKSNEHIIDLTKLQILNTLINLCKIEKELFSTIFIIEKKEEDNYTLKCLNDCKNYYLKYDDIFNLNEFILINNYYYNEEEIKLIDLSFIHKLDEKQLFYVLQKNSISNNIMVCKIIDIDYNYKGNILLCDRFKNLYKMNNYKNNHHFINKEIKLCELIILSNYNLESNIIHLKDNSFVYLSNQNIYYSDNIILNNYSVIQFNFLDFKQENEYDKIEINGIEKEIKENEMYFFIGTILFKNYDFYPITINLIKNPNVNNNKDNKTFKFILFHGLLNKINVFVNYIESNAYFYEFLYYNLSNNPFILCQKKIRINNKEIPLLIYDCFDTGIRIRFNVLNIPFQYYSNKNIFINDNSLQVCEIFNDNNQSEIFGIFNIKEIEIRELEQNSIFDEYYDEFANIYNCFYLNQINYDKKELINFITVCKEKYNKLTINKELITSLSQFEDKFTYSEFKTRIGIIICYYINLLCTGTSLNSIIIKTIHDIIKQIKKNENNLSLNDRIRIIFFCLRKKLVDEKVCQLMFFSKIKKKNEKSPYILAKNCNLEEIKNLDEKSSLFLSYLQLDSYILKNYYYNGEKSYSLSIELVFILKNHLIKNYEDFFFIEKQISDEFAYQAIDENITVINEGNLFDDQDIFEKIYEINEIKKSKNYAMPISMEFRHEKNGHMKKSLKNKHLHSPILYLKNGKVNTLIYKELNNIKIGESGKIIEKCINEDPNIIRELKLVKIYGEILDYKLFIKKDFNELKLKMDEIRNKNKTNKELIDFKISLKSDKDEKTKIEERRIKQLEKQGIIKCGDVYYSKIARELYKKRKIYDPFKLPKFFYEIENQ